MTVKIIDFGLARDLSEEHKIKSPGGSTYYQAPETTFVSKPTKISEKIDVWGVGCVLIFMCTEKPLFNVNASLPLDQNISIIHDKIRRADFDNKINNEIFPNLSEFCKKYLTVTDENLRASSS